MKRGDPHLTDELDRTRAEQRRALRGIPDWLLPRHKVKRPGPRPTASECGLLEVELRTLANGMIDTFLTVGDVDWRPPLEAHARAEALYRWSLTSEDAGWDQVAMDLRRDMERAFNDARIDRVSPDLAPAVRRFVTLVLWADHLADDGYADSRAEDCYTDGLR